MRTFVVYAGTQEVEVEMPDDASEQECVARCESELDELLNRIDSGWDETTGPSKKNAENGDK